MVDIAALGLPVLVDLLFFLCSFLASSARLWAMMELRTLWAEFMSSNKLPSPL